jgi:hypothetical protein
MSNLCDIFINFSVALLEAITMDASSRFSPDVQTIFNDHQPSQLQLEKELIFWAVSKFLFHKMEISPSDRVRFPIVPQMALA